MSASQTSIQDAPRIFGHVFDGQVLQFNGTNDDCPKKVCETVAQQFGAVIGANPTIIVNLSENDSKGFNKETLSIPDAITHMSTADFCETLLLRPREVVANEWFSDLNAFEAYWTKKTLGLPVTKALTYIAQEGSEAIIRTNQFGVHVPINKTVYKSHEVLDFRARPDGEGWYVIDVICADGYEVNLPVNHQYFAEMQKGVKAFADSMERGSESE